MYIFLIVDIFLLSKKRLNPKKYEIEEEFDFNKC